MEQIQSSLIPIVRNGVSDLTTAERQWIRNALQDTRYKRGTKTDSTLMRDDFMRATNVNMGQAQFQYAKDVVSGKVKKWARKYNKSKRRRKNIATAGMAVHGGTNLVTHKPKPESLLARVERLERELKGVDALRASLHSLNQIIKG